MRTWTFDTFPADDAAGAAALTAAREWCESEAEQDLYLFGGVGSGKTGLAWSCLVELLNDNPRNAVHFCNVRQTLARVRRSFDGDSEDDPTDDLIGALYLVLDDLGAERRTDWAREWLATVIEARYVAEVVQTIVTSNYGPSELARRLGHDDPVIGLRLVSRLTENAVQIRLDRPDLRAQRAERAVPAEDDAYQQGVIELRPAASARTTGIKDGKHQ